MPDTSVADACVTAPPQPTRLVDYRPPDFLVETVDLEFDLDPADTIVLSKLHLRRNPDAAWPKGAGNAPLQLDGDELELIALTLDGRPLVAGDYRIEPDGALIIADVPDS